MSRDQQAKLLAKKLNIPYSEALRRVRKQREMESLFPSLESLLPEEITGQCRSMAGSDVARDVGRNRLAGLTFDEVELPTDILHELVLDEVLPDLATIDWQMVDPLPDGDQVVTVEVEAHVRFTGWGPPAGVADRDDVRLVDSDVDGFAEVTFDRQVQLNWHVVYRPGVDFLSFEFAGASELVPIHPHA
ncbi:hypothetical protein [Micromonospora sp. WMMD1082]|uniref:hypothetical protein n=1 Tax=Micromonospora sp. WMMD1082 TaxID=3016104 RepID=UPI0024174E02|nr:hypothetical protein [Micromonospora sp. WMMD1082]MDG4796892.1 hypothetical protein [Micromonospora sp. WMMD1082]